jgi:hypothetical protein
MINLVIIMIDFYLAKRVKSFRVLLDDNTLKRISAILITISVTSLIAAVFLSIENNDTNRHAIAQQIINESFVNDTETVGELDKILGNNTAIILSDEYISNPNNTLLDSINTNIQEDCMKVTNTNHLYCP